MPLHNFEVAVIAKVKGILVAHQIAHNVNHATICLVGTIGVQIEIEIEIDCQNFTQKVSVKYFLYRALRCVDPPPWLPGFSGLSTWPATKSVNLEKLFG